MKNPKLRLFQSSSSEQLSSLQLTEESWTLDTLDRQEIISQYSTDLQFQDSILGEAQCRYHGMAECPEPHCSFSMTLLQPVAQMQQPEIVISYLTKKSFKRMSDLVSRRHKGQYTVIVAPDFGSLLSISCSSLQEAANVLRKYTTQAINSFSLADYSFFVISGSALKVSISQVTGTVLIEDGNVAVRGEAIDDDVKLLTDGRLDVVINSERASSKDDQDLSDLF